MSELKQVIVMRTDLEMSVGKSCAQAAHASIMACMQAKPSDIMEWITNYSMTKIVCGVACESSILHLERSCNNERFPIPCAVVRDNGKTEVEPGTITAIGIGPFSSVDINRITGNLPLYK